jgi:hypothetical protein
LLTPGWPSISPKKPVSAVTAGSSPYPLYFNFLLPIPLHFTSHHSFSLPSPFFTPPYP